MTKPKQKPIRSPLTAGLIAEMNYIMDIIERTDEVGDCWIWNSTVSKPGGYPIMNVSGCGCRLVRREAFMLAGGVLLPRQPVDVICDERRCVNPAHLVASSTAKIAQKAADQGKFSSLARGAKIAAARRTKAKITIEDARVIRMSDEANPVLAARYGVNKSVIQGVKSGARWRDYSNPFVGLMALNDGDRRRA